MYGFQLEKCRLNEIRFRRKQANSLRVVTFGRRNGANDAGELEWLDAWGFLLPRVGRSWWS